MRDTTRLSRFKNMTTVFGRTVAPAFDGADFEALKPAWSRILGRNRGLAEAYRRKLAGRRGVLVELHNRPIIAHWLARTAPGLPLTIRLANDPLSTSDLRQPRARHRLLQRMRAIYCVSDFVRRRFLQDVRGGEEKLHVVHNGIGRPAVRPVGRIR